MLERTRKWLILLRIVVMHSWQGVSLAGKTAQYKFSIIIIIIFIIIIII